MRSVMQQVGTTAGSGGWMQFKTRVRYTSSNLNDNSLTFSLQDGEVIMFIDKIGTVQIVNPIFDVSGAYPYIVAYASSTSIGKITYGGTSLDASANLNYYFSEICIGTLIS